MSVHRLRLVLSRRGTKAGRAPGRRAAVLAAAAVAGGGMWLAVPAASAASPECGPACITLVNLKFGSADVMAVSGGTEAAGQAVILSAAAPSTTEDWTESFEGVVSDFVAAGIINPTLGEHYGSDAAFEFEYAPGGIGSGLCLGIGSGPSQSTPVTLQPCGVSANTLWIEDTADANGLGAIFISGSGSKYPAPYVLTANTVGGNFTTQALRTNPGADARAQRWVGIFGVLP
jgi:hypothetical protein